MSSINKILNLSKKGYKKNSPHVDRPFNVIPSNEITMKEDDGTPLKKGPILGIGIGKILEYKKMMPGKDYKFSDDVEYVIEKPIDDYQLGGQYSPKERMGVRQNPDGTVSSHLMMTEVLPNGNWVSFPSLFQNEDKSWVDMSKQSSWYPIYLEAQKRGEVYNFGKNKEAALAFGRGSWKKEYQKGGQKPTLYVNPNDPAGRARYEAYQDSVHNFNTYATAVNHLNKDKRFKLVNKSEIDKFPGAIRDKVLYNIERFKEHRNTDPLYLKDYKSHYWGEYHDKDKHYQSAKDLLVYSNIDTSVSGGLLDIADLAAQVFTLGNKNLDRPIKEVHLIPVYDRPVQPIKYRKPEESEENEKVIETKPYVPNLNTDLSAWLKTQGTSASFADRKKLYEQTTGQTDYKGTAEQNIGLLNLLKERGLDYNINDLERVPSNTSDETAFVKKVNARPVNNIDEFEKPTKPKASNSIPDKDVDTTLTKQIPKTQWKQLPDGTWYKDTKAGNKAEVVTETLYQQGGSIPKFQTAGQKPVVKSWDKNNNGIPDRVENEKRRESRVREPWEYELQKIMGEPIPRTKQPYNPNQFYDNPLDNPANWATGAAIGYGTKEDLVNLGAGIVAGGALNRFLAPAISKIPGSSQLLSKTAQVSNKLSSGLSKGLSTPAVVRGKTVPWLTAGNLLDAYSIAMVPKIAGKTYDAFSEGDYYGGAAGLLETGFYGLGAMNPLLRTQLADDLTSLYSGSKQALNKITTQTTSVKAPTSPFNTRAQNDLLLEQARKSGEAPLPSYMEPYISRRYTPAAKEQEVFESFLSPEKQAELRKLRTQTFNPKNQYKKGGSIPKFQTAGQKYPNLFNFDPTPEYVGYQGIVPVAESTRVVNTYKPTQQEIKATKEYSKKVGDLAQNIKKESNVSQKVAMQQAEQILEANSRIQPEAKAYANTKQAQERDAYVFDEGMNARDYFRYPLQFLAGRIPTEEERIQDRIRITNPRTSNLDKFMGTVGQAAGLAPEALINTGIGLAFAPSRFSKLGMVTDAISPIGNPFHPDFIKSVNQAGEYLTTQTPLRNVYKYIPGTVKEAPLVPMYRTQKPGQTQEVLELLDLQKKANEVGISNLSTAEKIKLSQFQTRPNIGQGFDTDLSKASYYGNPNIRKTRGYDETPEILRTVVPREQAELFNVKNFPEYAKQSTATRTEHILPMDMVQQAEKFSFDDLVRLREEESLLNPKPHWLRGYKPVEVEELIPVFRVAKPGQLDETLNFLRVEKKAKELGVESLTVKELEALYNFRNLNNESMAGTGYGQGFTSDISDIGYYGSPRIRKTRGYTEEPELFRTYLTKTEADKYNTTKFKDYATAAQNREFLLPLDKLENVERFKFSDYDRLTDEFIRFKKAINPNYKQGGYINNKSVIARLLK